jgi:plastocyanin
MSTTGFAAGTGRVTGAEREEPAGERSSGRPPSRLREAILFMVMAAIVGAMVGGVLGVLAWRGFTVAAEERAAARVLVAIPAGTGARITSGSSEDQASGLPPSAVNLSSGDTLVLRNDDSQVHEIGGYSIAPGSVLELTVDPDDSGRFVCTFASAGTFDLDVAPPLQASTIILPATLIGLPVGAMMGLVAWFARSLGGPDEPPTRRREQQDD